MTQLDDPGSGGLTLLSLDLHDHLDHLPQAVALALDLVLQAGRQIPLVSRAQRQRMRDS
ncbi:hypothetical protein [Mesorhizobium intechi]|uniref:hypothetical protein n=1 Tax=Mesorhizobium intechi TaxID=537601 RepID=UPI00142EDB34|nr:hypothetical protein [Mesorhizobium intechi]